MSDIEDADVTELADVALNVSALRPVHGRGNVRYALDVELEIPGVSIALLNCSLREDPPGQLKFAVPATRCFRTGETRPAVALSKKLLAYVGEMALDLVLERGFCCILACLH